MALSCSSSTEARVSAGSGLGLDRFQEGRHLPDLVRAQRLPPGRHALRGAPGRDSRVDHVDALVAVAPPESAEVAARLGALRVSARGRGRRDGLGRGPDLAGARRALEAREAPDGEGGWHDHGVLLASTPARPIRRAGAGAASISSPRSSLEDTSGASPPLLVGVTPKVGLAIRSDATRVARRA